MANENFDIMSAFIADIEAKIAALQAVLVSLQSASALGALGGAVEGIALPSGTSGSSGDLGQPMDLPEGAFLGKSVAVCIKLYLSSARKKKTAKEITTALREGGVESTSGKFENIITSTLNRLKGAGEVLRFKDGWGLSEWYPANIRTSAPSGAPKRTQKKMKRNAHKNAGAKSPTASDRITALLRTKPEREYSPTEIAEHIGVNVQVVRLILGTLRKSGKVKISAPGMYAIGRPQLMAVAQG